MGQDQSCCSKRQESKGNIHKISKVPKGEVVTDIGAIGAKAYDPKPSTETVSKAEKVGIGAYFQKSQADPGGLAVKSLLANSPAQQCGKITVGDIILSVNGENVYGKKLAELAEVLLGPPGSEVTLVFKREASDEKYDVKMTRGIPGFN
mmetsp:Transcript_56216/g.114963  ORF Transcript_56216/g.114963 Transcript_56216/m.114963 type:complete len:149 (-) Transcript_56216:326-772(-)|eukprot:CAMPEP_0181318714 /NCGR_PEP_ID=MMETSP1101-20121128/17157_1 /TAXON_ID=46948 /ORGANISM="Rhodomonas abbreviata, Strain Caron Lab Isolate" /LENGTH=148 /DNA_ID=CAMNT_0023426209 /DNA_START=217 /DNA_END=663 /DNA_ORIENTATION=-